MYIIGSYGMKKYGIFLLLLLVSLLLTPFSYAVNATTEEELKIETYYPQDILDYADLTNITHFSIANNAIAYTLNGQDLLMYNKLDKMTTTITGFTNIKLIKYVKGNILVVDSGKIYIIDNYTKSNVSQLAILKNNLPEIKAIDIYSTNTKTYIGYVSTDVFTLLEYTSIINNAIPNSTKTFTSGYYLNAYMLALNNNTAYIVYKTAETNPPSQNGICIQNYSSNSPLIKDNFVLFAKLIDTFYSSTGQEYIVTFTNELLVLLNKDMEVIDDVTIGTDIDINNNIFPILDVTDLDYHNNTLYLSDKHYKTIQSFIINEGDTTNFQSTDILLCGNNQAKGRFNNVDNIYIQGSTLYTADTNNNRLQVLSNESTQIINMPENYSKPISICRDSNNVIYTASTNLTKDKILKYQFVNNEYKLSSVLEPSKTNAKLSSLTLANDSLHALDYHNNEIIYITDNTTHFKCKFTNLDDEYLDVLENSQIHFAKKENKIVILNNEIIYLLDLSGNTVSEMNLPNCTDITVGLSEIYALVNNRIYAIDIENDSLVNNNLFIENNDFSTLTTITFDDVNRRIYAFNSTKSCISYFDCDLIETKLVFDEFANTTNTTIDTIPYFYKLNYAPPIYTHPYSLGEVYSEEIEYAIAVGHYDDYVRIIYNDNGTLKEGFVHSSRCTKLDYTYKPTNVIAVNQLVPVYKYPTILTLNNKPITCETIPIYTKITLTHTCPVSIDGKTFYMFQSNGKVGFLYAKDIILDSSKNISNLNTDNATIVLFDKEEIKLLAEDKTTPIYSLKNDSRIFVEEYDKHSEYTKVVYKDKSLKVYTGYVETKYIEMDKMDISKIILIAIISISILILIVILIVYISLKKKK